MPALQPPRKAFYTLNGKRLALNLFLLAVACAGMHLFLGAAPIDVFLCVAASGIGLVGFVALGPYNVGAWISLFYVLGNTLVAIYAKAALGQALDSNLSESTLSFCLLLISSLALLSCLLFVRRIPLGPPLFDQVRDLRRLRWLSWGCFILGTGASVLNRLFSDTPDESTSFGGFAIFHDLLLMAVIARTAMVLERSQDSRSFDLTLGAMMAIGVLLGLVDNQKTAAALPVISWFVTMLIYRGRISRKTVVVLALGGAAFSFIISPFVHAMRALGQQEMKLADRIEFVVDMTSQLVESPDRFAQIEQLAASQFGNGYYDYFGENGSGQMLLGRYTSVQQIDPVIAEHEKKGDQGGDVIWPAFVRLLPSLINANKSADNGQEFTILVNYGLIDPAGGKNPSLPIVGQAYAAYGYPGAVLLPAIGFFLALLVLKKLNWGMDRNVYGIFWFCQFVIVYASQGSFGQYVTFALRWFPSLALIFWLVVLPARIAVRRAAA